MMETIRIGEWIPRQIYADTSAVTIIGVTGVYKGVGPDQTKKVFVTYKFVSGSPTHKLGPRRTVAGCLYDIAAWGREADLANLKIVAERIDEIFSHQVNDQWKNWNFSSQFDSAIETYEPDDANKTKWIRMGGTYSITAFDLTYGAG